ncbi:MAG: iron donor protein CyaY [Polyangiaceae bacterium]|nr:iron donor protein CyaY [Polyangiaceae bacterium]
MPNESEHEYLARALPELQALLESLDALEDVPLEVELANDILEIGFEDGSKYVVNSHRAARQLWMAAERSAWHFEWDPSRGRWTATKTGDELWETLAQVLGRKLGRDVGLARGAGPAID